ncbi:MAG: CPBP family intramembrane metalloprotease [Butyrivibrio sp.]|nr:CPBP family intramembrane metalloprotease [Butyrivibrio sp.]
MNSLVKKYAFPVVWELAFIIAYILLPDTIKTLNIFIIFYLGIGIFYYKEFSFHRYFRNLKSFKGFWIPVIATFIAGLILHYLKTDVIRANLPWISTQTYSITRRNSLLSELTYAFTVIFVGPIAEELLFRKAIMSFESKNLTIITFFVGLLLCAFSHAYLPVGVMEALILAVPFSIAYYYTRNIYVPITVHILLMMYEQLPDIAYDLARISMQ